jgi:NTP pyrophosphatase (non-canonical NTP hydrolase)
MQDIQAKVKRFAENHQMQAPLEHRLLDLQSEIGELSKEVLKMTDYGTQPLRYKPEFKSEMGDVLFSLIQVANYFDLSLSEALDEVLEKYTKRLQKGSAGSEQGEEE